MMVNQAQDNYYHGEMAAQKDDKEEYVEELRLLNIYATKSFLMATAWLSGFVAAFTHTYGLWILFIIMNASQGIFMFKSFVLQPDVKRMWKKKLNEMTKKTNAYKLTGTQETKKGIKVSDKGQIVTVKDCL